MRRDLLAVCAVVIVALPGVGQVAVGPHFEVASVRLASGNTPFSGFTGGPGSSSPGKIQYSPVALRTLICEALRVKRDQIFGPAWIDSLSYVISATLPPRSTKEDLDAMTLHLLEERFDFAFHREARNLERLELHVENSGPKLGAPVSTSGTGPDAVTGLNNAGPREKDARGFPILPAGPAWAQQRGEDGVMRLTCKSCSMRFLGSMPLATLLSRQQGFASRSVTQIVEDRTDLAGQYDFHLRYIPSSPTASGSEPTLGPGEDLAMALRHQLGLRVVSVKAPIDVIVVDRLNRVPTEN